VLCQFSKVFHETLRYYVSTNEHKFLISQKYLSVIILSAVSVILSEDMK